MLHSSAGSAAAGPARSDIASREQAYKQRLGERSYARFEQLKKQERQRVWDAMRTIASERFKEHGMPDWFKPEWLDIQEAPTNTWWRQRGLSAYRMDDAWLGESAPPALSSGGGDGDGSGSRPPGGGGRGWWREEDPYWPLRDWGDHPMRWWTWGLAGALAAGGVWVHARSGSAAAVHLGFGAAALLGLSAVAMSDMRDSDLGELGVKVAWAVTAVLAARDFIGAGLAPLRCRQQQHHQQQHARQLASYGWHDAADAASSSSHALNDAGARLTGWLCFAAAAAYMATGMSGLARYALPTNPGEAFKMVDVAERHKVWDFWGYGNLTMRV